MPFAAPRLPNPNIHHHIPVKGMEAEMDIYCEDIHLTGCWCMVRLGGGILMCPVDGFYFIFNCMCL